MTRLMMRMRARRLQNVCKPKCRAISARSSCAGMSLTFTERPIRRTWRSSLGRSLDERVERPDLSVGEDRDVHTAQDWGSSGRAALPAQSADVVNDLCVADHTEREARRALIE